MYEIMESFDPVIYKLLLWIIPVAFGLLAFVGALGVKAIITMGVNLNDIKVIVARVASKNDGLDHRVHTLEKKVFK